MIVRKLIPAGLVALGLLSGVPAAAYAVPLPVATTEGISEVTFDTATLNGTVLAGGGEALSDTRWCFEYGSATGSGYNLGFLPLLPGDAGTGTSDEPVGLRLTGLAAGDTYRYRLVAVNSLGQGLGSTACGTEGGQEADGAEGLFTTPNTVPSPLASTGSVSEVSQNTARISGTVDPQGSPTTFEFQLGVDTSYGVQLFGSAGEGSEPNPVALDLYYLQPGVTYHYRLVALGAGGTSYGADATFTTPTYPTAALTAPTASPLLATPSVTFPANAAATTTVKHKAKSKRKAVKKTKKRPKKTTGRTTKKAHTSKGGNKR